MDSTLMNNYAGLQPYLLSSGKHKQLFCPHTSCIEIWFLLYMLAESHFTVPSQQLTRGVELGLKWVLLPPLGSKQWVARPFPLELYGAHMISPNKNKTADDGGGQCHSNMPVYMGMVLAIRQSLIEYATSWILVSSEKSTGTQSAVCLTKL